MGSQKTFFVTFLRKRVEKNAFSQPVRARGFEKKFFLNLLALEGNKKSFYGTFLCKRVTKNSFIELVCAERSQKKFLTTFSVQTGSEKTFYATLFCDLVRTERSCWRASFPYNSLCPFATQTTCGSGYCGLSRCFMPSLRAGQLQSGISRDITTSFGRSPTVYRVPMFAQSPRVQMDIYCWAH